MTHQTALILALLASTGGEIRQDAGPRTAVPPPRAPKTQADPIYKIGDDRDEGPARRVVDVNLTRKVTPEVLREIALEVKSKAKRPHERTAIFYYLPAEFVDIAGQPWASTHFKPTLEVVILGLSREEEEAMGKMPLNHPGKRVGAWLPDDQYKTLDLIYDDGSLKIAEIRATNERSDSDLVELPSPTGRRFRKVKGRNIYAVDPAGNLRISNADGQVISAARPMK